MRMLPSIGCRVAGLSVFADQFLRVNEPFGPVKGRSFVWVVASKMTDEASFGASVFQFGVAEDFAAHRCQSGIVREQFLPSVDMIVVMVVLAVVVEPRLHALGKILVMVHARILALPQAGLHRGVVRGSQPSVERRVHVVHAAQVDVVSDLVDQDVLRRIRIAGVAQQILFAARAVRIGFAAAHSTRSSVPVLAARQGGEVLWRRFGKTGEFRLVGGEFVPTDDAQPRAALYHRLPHIGSFGEQQIDEIRRLRECIRIYSLRGDDRKSSRRDPLRIERRHAAEAERLYGKFASDCRLGLVLAPDDGEAMPNRRRDDSVSAGFDGAVRHPLGR